MERRDSKIYLITGQSHGCLLEIVFFFFIVELMSLRILRSGASLGIDVKTERRAL